MQDCLVLCYKAKLLLVGKKKQNNEEKTREKKHNTTRQEKTRREKEKKKKEEGKKRTLKTKSTYDCCTWRLHRLGQPSNRAHRIYNDN